MAWMTANIYVRTDDPDGVAASVERLLEAGELCTDRDGILDAPQPVVVSPAYQGWVAVLRAREWLSPLPEVAARLSAEGDTEVVSAEVVGNSYRARLCRVVAGEETARTTAPEGGFSDDPLDQPDLQTMPLYDDVELQAFDFLRKSGVPAPLSLLGAAPLGYPSRGDLPLGEGVTLSAGPGGTVTRGTVEVTAVDYRSDDPPSVPTHVSRDFGLMLMEERYVEGAPTEKSLDRLLDIEKELLQRAIRAAPGERVSLTVTYNAPLHQDRLDAMLRARDRHTLAREMSSAPPWWQFWRHFGLRRP